MDVYWTFLVVVTCYEGNRQKLLNVAAQCIELHDYCILHHHLLSFHFSFSVGVLLPLPGESVQTSALKLGATLKTIGSSMVQFLTTANQCQLNTLISHY